MPILDKWELQLNIDDVLRGQGADPEVIRSRRPALVKITEEALLKGQYLLHPQVLYEQFEVKRFTHERLDLLSHQVNLRKPHLSGELIANHLAKAQEIIVMVCTIGSELDEAVSSFFKINPTLAIALDGMGSAAVELLGIQACNYFEEQAKNKGLNTSLPLNPGMVGWPVAEGQPQIFSLLESEEIHVSLTDSWMMVPNKSVSQVLGIGEDLSANGSTCEYCSLKGVCKYQNHYARQD